MESMNIRFFKEIRDFGVGAAGSQRGAIKISFDAAGTIKDLGRIGNSVI